MVYPGSGWRDEKGLATVLVAIMGTVLLGMVGLAVDVGLAYLNEARLQSGVDAAALAGAQELPGNPGAAVETALAYAGLNGLAAGEVEASVAEGGTALNVSARRQTRFFFAPALGFDGTEVGAAATARVGALSAVKGVVPVGVQEQNLEGEEFGFKQGVRYVLKEGGGGETGLGSGNYGILEVDKFPHWYQETMRDGSGQTTKVGQNLLTASGVRSGDTYDAISARIAACQNPTCTPENFERGCPRVMLLPVYRPLGDANNIKEVEIVGFADFWVEAVAGQGNSNDISGYFVNMVHPGQFDFNLKGYGALGERLTR